MFSRKAKNNEDGSTQESREENGKSKSRGPEEGLDPASLDYGYGPQSSGEMELAQPRSQQRRSVRRNSTIIRTQDQIRVLGEEAP